MQRRFRIDASAVCTLTSLHLLLINCDSRTLVLERVAQMYLSLKYGKRVSRLIVAHTA